MFNVALVHPPLYGSTEVRNTEESMPVLNLEYRTGHICVKVYVIWMTYDVCCKSSG